MIFGTYRQFAGAWVIAIPRDEFWGSEKPRLGDRVTVLKRDGSFKECVLDNYAKEYSDTWLVYARDERAYFNPNDYDNSYEERDGDFGWDFDPFYS